MNQRIGTIAVPMRQRRFDFPFQPRFPVSGFVLQK
jgi:hypothetical protein